MTKSDVFSLIRPELFIRKTDFNTTVRMPHVSDIMHPHFRISQKSPHLATDELLQQYINEDTYSDYYVNLRYSLLQIEAFKKT